jgi:hypothetical protein
MEYTLLYRYESCGHVNLSYNIVTLLDWSHDYVQPWRDGIFLYDVSSFKYVLFLGKAILLTSEYHFSFLKGSFRETVLPPTHITFGKCGCI